MRKSKILTIDDLIRFCESGKINYFNAEESGYSLRV